MISRSVQWARATFRVLWLSAEILCAMACYFPAVRWRRNRRAAQARWLQATSRRGLRVIGARVSAGATLPQHGLLVSNHLSYVDILVLSSLAPCTFVSKSEVRSWPVFGWFASLSGTIFVRRERKTDVTTLNRQIADALAESALVVLFPEGTTSDGSALLPFKSALLEPAAASAHPLHVARIEYTLTDGDPGQDVCYWGGMTLVPHLLKLMTKRGIQATVRSARIEHRSVDRKVLARELQAEIGRLATSKPQEDLRLHEG